MKKAVVEDWVVKKEIKIEKQIEKFRIREIKELEKLEKISLKEQREDFEKRMTRK